ncbi:MAG: hypothetical protein GXO21_03060 [Aquificae bacterium]|nr:hypothetical protein [Aquificota bacterium]
MKINRFPKMAALQKERALKLGYPEDLAEAIGIAEALKYAIFKRIAQTGTKYKDEEEKKSKETQTLDWEKFKIFKLASKDGWPYVAGSIKTPEDYKKEIFQKWGEETGKKIEEWAKNIIQQTPEEYLKDEQKFFKKVWVPHRDEEIT